MARDVPAWVLRVDVGGAVSEAFEVECDARHHGYREAVGRVNESDRWAVWDLAHHSSSLVMRRNAGRDGLENRGKGQRQKEHTVR